MDQSGLTFVFVLLWVLVCAGTVIAREAGGKCYGKGGKVFDLDGSGQDLMGHHFFVIRGIADQDGESGEEIQDRLAKQFFENVAEEWDAWLISVQLGLAQ